MFKVKNLKNGEIVQVLSTYCDEYGKSWFLIWKDKWCWRAADDFVPPNYVVKKKVIIAGSREFDNFKLLSDEMNKIKDVVGEVVCGGARGADTLGRNWAVKNEIAVKDFPADWGKYGNSAGYIRNHDMGDYADMLVAFWNGISAGTRDMIDYMEKLHKEIKVIKF